eukprot:UN00074
MGCVSQLGPQGCNVARNVVMASKLPIATPATTVDRQCGSGLQAVRLAVAEVMSGLSDVVIAGGVESMTLVPLGSNVSLAIKAGMNGPNSDAIHQRFPTDDEPPTFSQFNGAELCAQEFKVTRADADQYAVEAHALAADATQRGYFKNEIVPVKGLDKDGKEVMALTDEGIRPGTTVEKLGKLPLLIPGSDNAAHTAGTSSQVCDGASAVLIMNEEGLRKTGLKPRCKIIAIAQCSDDPVIMLRAPLFSTEKLLKQYNMKITDIDFFEVNAAFAAIPLMFMRYFKLKRNQMNVHGDAVALGHPLGATGAKLLATALNALEIHNKKRALITLCEGGGQATSLVIERITQDNAKL